MRPTISYMGKDYPVQTISWFKDGGLANVTFYVDKEKLYTAHNKLKSETESYTDGILVLDLEKRVKWGEVNAAGNNLD